jgi:hypothetical protein
MVRKIADETTQMGIRLPKRLYDRLKTVAGQGNIGEEIRNRLETSFASEDADRDPKLSKALAMIAAVGGVTSEEGQWLAPIDTDAAKAFEAGVAATLAEFKPKGPPPIKRCEWTLRGGDPATIGRTAALMALRES